jgi:hypothetical protein
MLRGSGAPETLPNCVAIRALLKTAEIPVAEIAARFRSRPDYRVPRPVLNPAA